MTFAGCNLNCTIDKTVNKPVCVIDSSAAKTGQVSAKKLRFSDAGAIGAFNIPNRLINAFYGFFVLTEPVLIVVPCFVIDLKCQAIFRIPFVSS